MIFSLVSYIGATTTLEIVWSFSDIMNGLMAIPNLICLIALSGVIAKDVKEYQEIIKVEKSKKDEKLEKLNLFEAPILKPPSYRDTMLSSLLFENPLKYFGF